MSERSVTKPIAALEDPALPPDQISEAFQKAAECVTDGLVICMLHGAQC